MFYKVLTWDYIYAGLPDWTNITAEEKLSLSQRVLATAWSCLFGGSEITSKFIHP